MWRLTASKNTKTVQHSSIGLISDSYCSIFGFTPVSDRINARFARRHSQHPQSFALICDNTVVRNRLSVRTVESRSRLMLLTIATFDAIMMLGKPELTSFAHLFYRH
ncbi:hypothetical protein GCK32_022153 [Trichostrongylus colubriformis]|uniref:Uncharacterized protein n=1 Tax=Trichostrongylus colubriformis TaxID=6319 RepID=A0AAN8IE29_TRICO